MSYLSKDGKRVFIKQLMASIQADALARIDQMPDDWDGFELRQYLADKFADAAHGMDRKRAASYKNEMIVRNL